jgi:hypothetical protein
MTHIGTDTHNGNRNEVTAKQRFTFLYEQRCQFLLDQAAHFLLSNTSHLPEAAAKIAALSG